MNFKHGMAKIAKANESFYWAAAWAGTILSGNGRNKKAVRVSFFKYILGFFDA